jgi:hypothetical protein
MLPTVARVDSCYSLQDNQLGIKNPWSDPFYEPDFMSPQGQYGFPEMNLTNQQQEDATFTSTDTQTHAILEDIDVDNQFQISPVSLVHKLAKLNVALYDCSEKLPSMPGANANPESSVSQSCGSRNKKPFSFDELFRLTNEFIELIKSLSPGPSGTVSLGCQNDHVSPAIADMQQLCNTLHSNKETAATSIPVPYLDEGTKLMILSCHCRLTDIYISMFEMMQACIEFSTIPKIDSAAGVILPRLQVGSHATPQVKVDKNNPMEVGTSRMYMVLVTMLSSQLHDTLADVMRAGLDNPTESESVSRDLFEASVTEGTARMGRSIDEANHLLQKFSLAPK